MTLLFTLGILLISFLGIGVGVLFFGKDPKREACGTVPDVEKHTDCPSKKMGLCPVLDKSGVVKMASTFKLGG